MAKQKEPHVTPDEPISANANEIPGELSVTEEQLVRVTATKLNLRQGPSRDFAVKTVLEEGTVAVVLDLPYDIEVPGWALVHVSDELIGWVDCQFIQEVEA